MQMLTLSMTWPLFSQYFFLRLFAPGVIMSHLPTIRTSKSFVFEDNKTKAVKLKSKKRFQMF